VTIDLQFLIRVVSRSAGSVDIMTMSDISAVSEDQPTKPPRMTSWSLERAGTCLDQLSRGAAQISGNLLNFVSFALSPGHDNFDERRLRAV
jgi:hypothetical protein